MHVDNIFGGLNIAYRDVTIMAPGPRASQAVQHIISKGYCRPRFLADGSGFSRHNDGLDPLSTFSLLLIIPGFASAADDVHIITIAIAPLGSQSNRPRQFFRTSPPSDDAIITVHESVFLELANGDALQALQLGNEFLFHLVRSLVDLISAPDFDSTARRILKFAGDATAAVVMAPPHQTDDELVAAAINHPMLGVNNLRNAKGVLAIIYCRDVRTASLCNCVEDSFKKVCDRDAIVAMKTVVDPTISEECVMTVIATGISS